MIAKDTFSIYSQHNEDIILAALLYSVKKGFYVDVGANHESYHSVTKYFYERGWSGINIEPIEKLLQPFYKKRSNDINLPIALSDKKGELLFREYLEQDGLSTLLVDSSNETAKADLPHKDYKVKVDTLASVLKTYHPKQIEFLKIDVEGFEMNVLKGNDWTKYRPKVICIEANHRQSDWSDFITSKNYTKVMFDGLNEYYLENNSLKLMNGFAERSALLFHNAVRRHHLEVWEKDIKDIEQLRALSKRQDDLIRGQHTQIEGLQKILDNSKLLKIEKQITQIVDRLKIKVK